MVAAVGYIAKPSKAHKTPRVYFTVRGRTVSLPGFRVPAANRVLLRNCESLSSYVCAGNDGIPEHLVDWLTDQLDDERKAKLAEFGLLTGAQLAMGEPIGPHIDAWRDYLIADGSGAKHAESRRRHASAMCTRCGFEVYSQINPERAMAEYATVKAQHSSRTAQHYLGSIKAFCRWMKRFNRATRNMLEPVIVPSVKDAEITVWRQVLTPAEQVKLIKVTHASRWKTHHGALDGPERALLYSLALATGLRAGSLRSLVAASFHLDAEQSFVEASVKGGKVCRIALVDAKLIADLRKHLATKLPAAPAFNCPDVERFAKMIRRDYKRAGIVAEHGKQLDFHCLRTTFATAWADAGKPIEVLQEIMGHESIEVTRRYYIRVKLERQAEAMAAKPAKRKRA